MTAIHRLALSTFVVSTWVGCHHAPPPIVPAGLPTPGDLQAEVDRTYCFHPHELDANQIAQRSAELDRFWKKLEANPAAWLAPLRRELERPGHVPFFYYDGGQLLRELSKTKEDNSRVLRALTRADLRDVDRAAYLRTVHSFALAGMDTTAAAFKILDDPKFTVFIPAHSLTLGQNYCLVYMLLPAPEPTVIPAVLERMRHERDETAKKSLLLVAFYLARPETDALIHEIERSRSEKLAVTKHAAMLSKRIARESAFNLSKLAARGRSLDANAARSLRRERLATISDEALTDLDLLTITIRAARPGRRVPTAHLPQ